ERDGSPRPRRGPATDRSSGKPAEVARTIDKHKSGPLLSDHITSFMVILKADATKLRSRNSPYLASDGGDVRRIGRRAPTADAADVRAGGAPQCRSDRWRLHALERRRVASRA